MLAVSPSVTADTERSPTAAPALTVILAVADVALCTVTLLTVIPRPNDTPVTSSRKCVLTPVMATSSVSPWPAETGASSAIAAGPDGHKECVWQREYLWARRDGERAMTKRRHRIDQCADCQARRAG